MDMSKGELEDRRPEQDQTPGRTTFNLFSKVTRQAGCWRACNGPDGQPSDCLETLGAQQNRVSAKSSAINVSGKRTLAVDLAVHVSRLNALGRTTAEPIRVGPIRPLASLAR